MKKLLLLASCFLLSDACVGCQKPTESTHKYVKTALAQQGMPYKYYELREAELSRFMPIEDCVVPSTPPKTPDKELVDGCPVPKTPEKEINK